MKILCEDCLILPICINRDWYNILPKCTFIKEYMRNKVKDYANIRSMGKPTDEFNFNVIVGGLNRTCRLSVKKDIIFVSNHNPHSSTYVINRYEAISRYANDSL